MSAAPAEKAVAGPSSTPRRKGVLNVPEGSQPIVEAPNLDPNDVRTGDATRDYWEAAKRIKPSEDLKNIGNVPCARSALLTGMAGGAGFGAVTFLSRRRVGPATNWAVLTFIGISAVMWENCRRARAKELQQMAVIQEKFAHRHVSKLKRKDGGTSPSDPTDSGRAI